MVRLFSPLKIKDGEFKNRIFVFPMCQYSCDDGLPHDWHLVHLGTRAVGGAGLVIADAVLLGREFLRSPYWPLTWAWIWNGRINTNGPNRCEGGATWILA